MSIVEYKNYTSEIIQLIVLLQKIFIVSIKFIFDIFVSLKIYIYAKKSK